MVNVVAEKMSVNLSELGSGFMAMKKAQDLALDFNGRSVHCCF